MTLNAPEPLIEAHGTEDFACGEPELDGFLQRRALKNQDSGASRTYVVTDDERVVAYYSLAVGAVSREIVTGKVRRNMPEPIPVMILGRLAVDEEWKGKGLGKGLLKDAILRSLQAAEIAGIRAILVHAISEEAKAFYEKCGFSVSPIEEMTLMITLKEALAALN